MASDERMEGDEMNDMSEFEAQFGYEGGGNPENDAQFEPHEEGDSSGDPDNAIFKPLRDEHERADKVDAEAIDWLDEEELGQRIPLGMITLVAGRPGQGKSIWTADLAARISKNHGAVILSNLEDPLASVVKPRLEAAGADLTKVHFWNPTLPRDTETLETMVTALGVKLVVIDPVAAHLTVSIYNDQEVRQALSPLSKMAARTGCAIVIVTHTLKSVKKGAHPLEAIGGSGGGLAGAARVAYIFGPDPDEPTMRALGYAKMNIANHPPALVYEMDEAEWILGEGDRAQVLRTGKLTLLSTTGKTGLDYATALAVGTPADMEEDVKPEKRAIAVEWIENYLAGGARPVTELREDAAEQGIAWRTMQRAAAEIPVVKTRRDKHGKGNAFGPGSSIWWELPTGHSRILTPEVAEEVDVTVAEILAEIEAQASCCDKPDHQERFNADGKPEIYCANCETIIGTQETLDDPAPEGDDA